MSTASQLTPAVAAPARGAGPLAPAASGSPVLAPRAASRLGAAWLPRAAWTVGRTGRPGLLGLGLLLASALFLVSTHLPVTAEVNALRAEVASVRTGAPAAALPEAGEPVALARELPPRAELPVLLRQLFGRAAQARLAVDTARYESLAPSAGGVLRTQVSFSLTGSYPAVRAFLDATLATMPAVALSELSIERKSISDGEVEAQLRMTVYTGSAP